jgi:hypothetical protein
MKFGFSINTPDHRTDRMDLIYIALMVAGVDNEALPLDISLAMHLLT